MTREKRETQLAALAALSSTVAQPGSALLTMALLTPLIALLQGLDHVKYICKCSMIEIYNETIFDLLNPSQAQCQIREDIKNGVHLEGQAEQQVFSGWCRCLPALFSSFSLPSLLFLLPLFTSFYCST